MYNKILIIIFFIFCSLSCDILNSFIEPEDKVLLKKPKAVVVFLIGNVKYGDQNLKVGDEISSDHEIFVSKNSLVDLQMIQVKTDFIMRFKSESSFFLSSLQVNKKIQNTIFIKSGSGLFKVNKLAKDEDFKVVTPTSVAGVRGTFFLVSFIADVAVTYVKEGKVTVRPFIGALERSMGGSVEKYKILTSAYDYFSDEEEVLEAEQSTQVSKKEMETKLKDNPGLQKFSDLSSESNLNDNSNIDYDGLEASLQQRKKMIEPNDIKKPRLQQTSIRERRVFIDDSKGFEFASKDEISKPELRKNAIESRNKNNQNKLIDLMANVKRSRVETLILKSGQNIRGIIYEEGKFYIIEQPNGITKVPSKLVKGYVF